MVDDDKTFLATLEYYLRKKIKTKMLVESFANGEDCLNEIECKPTIDLVIPD